MTNLESQALPTFCFQSSFSSILDNCCRLYNLDEHDSINFKATFFFNFFKLRNQNELLDNNYIVINWKNMKSYIHESVLCTNKFLSLEEKIQNTKIQNIFKQHFHIKKDVSDNNLILTNMSFNVEKDLLKNHFNEKKIINICQLVINYFSSSNKVIPIELFIIIYFDIYLTFERNEKLLKNKNYELILLVILDRITTPSRLIPKVDTDEFLSALRLEPPLKDDFLFSTSLNTYDPTYSLDLLISYFGHEKWYQYFPFYRNEEKHNYFSFFEKPFFKTRINKRVKKYKKDSVNIMPEDFFEERNSQMIFNIWESRLYEKEKSFFNEVIKPAILNKKTSLDINTEKYTEINKIIDGIWDTSSFNFHSNESIGSCSIITGTRQSKNLITIKIYEGIFKESSDE